MRITQSYTRQGDYPEGETVVATAVGNDTGTTNFATGRLSRLSPSNRYVVENITIIDLHGENREEDVDTIGENMRRLFSLSTMQWFWEPPSPVTSERQVDQIAKFRQWNRSAAAGAETKGEEQERGYKPPIMFAVYGMMQQIVCARADPALFLDNAVWDTLIANDIPIESLKREGIIWVPRSGGQKSYLDGFHGPDRKRETLTAGPRFCRDNGDEEAALFLESLRSQKPREDGCDIILQIHHFLEECRNKELKDITKEARAVAAQEKQQEKFRKQNERAAKTKLREEEKKRKLALQEERKNERERKKQEKEDEKKRKQEERERVKAEKTPSKKRKRAFIEIESEEKGVPVSTGSKVEEGEDSEDDTIEFVRPQKKAKLTEDSDKSSNKKVYLPLFDADSFLEDIV